MSDRTEQRIPKESPTQNKLRSWAAEQELKSPPAFIEPVGAPPDRSRKKIMSKLKLKPNQKLTLKSKS